jgi:hypothetical protein
MAAAATAPRWEWNGLCIIGQNESWPAKNRLEGATSMEWEHRICPDRRCGGAWYILPELSCRDVWYVARTPQDHAWVVAAADAVCPRCGATLVTLLELEGGLCGEVLEPGPVLEFVRSL